MEEKQSTSTTLRRSAADPTADRMAARRGNSPVQTIAEDDSPEVARENIVKEMMRIFDGLLGCTAKRTGVSLAFLKNDKKGHTKETGTKPESAAQRKLEQEIYRLIKRLVELDSPNTGFALNVLINNGTYYYNKASVPLSFGTFLNSLVTYLEGHDCLSVCPDEMEKLKALLARG